MAYELKSVIPLGRSFEDYQDMFALTGTELAERILGCGDGPASFNAEATRRGYSVLSADPLYAYRTADIALRIDETFDESFRQVSLNAENFTWTRHRTLIEWKAARKSAMDSFLEDYEPGKAAGRYVEASLPRLPFEDASFGLALVSHLLFLYTKQLDEDFHTQSVLELLRVAREVRIFPLVDLDARPSPHLEAVKKLAEAAGYRGEELSVPYEVQRGADRMLRLRQDPPRGVSRL